MTHPIREIVLTGGPCGGKTSAMAYLEQELSERGYRVFIVCEVPTLIISSGVKDMGHLVSLQDERFWAVERRMLLMQRDFRLHYQALAEDFARAGEKVVILYDRAESDIRAYLGNEGFDRLMRDCGLTLNDVRDSYLRVLHLVTAANGAEQHYTVENNEARFETPEQARAADKRTLAAWYGHEHLLVIGNETNFEGKLTRTLNAVLDVLGDNQVKTQRKFLLEKMPEAAYLDSAVRVEITQHYLPAKEEGRIIRLRQSQQGDAVRWQRAEKIRLEGGKELIKSKIITGRDYKDELTFVDKSREPIEKTRYCFAEGTQYLELDQFHNKGGLVLLEVKGDDIRKAIDLPSWLSVVREVTGEPEFYNDEMAANTTQS